MWVNSLCRSEGFPLAGYFVPGRDGMGVWPNSKILPGGVVCFTQVPAWALGLGPGPGPFPLTGVPPPLASYCSRLTYRPLERFIGSFPIYIYIYIYWPKTGQNWSPRIVPGRSSYLTKYELTISHGDPFQAPGHFCNFHGFPEKSFKSPPRGSRDSRNFIIMIIVCL